MERKKLEHKEQKVVSFQETSDDIQDNPKLKYRQPTVQPKDIEEIEY